MVKNKRVTKRDTDSDTDTEVDEKKVMNTKGYRGGKKNKLYMMAGLALLVIVVFMWYRRKNKAKIQANGQVATGQVMQRPMSQMPQMQQMQQMPQMQMGGMQRLNPIQEIQLTQMH
jgi:LPXTG-motif cell wall-anchored protein